MKFNWLIGSALLLCACSGSLAPSTVVPTGDNEPAVVVPPSAGTAAWEKDRAAAWSEVDRLVDEQKYQAALLKVDEIVNASTLQGDSPEQVRSIIRRLSLESALDRREEAVDHLIASVETWPRDLISRTLLGLYLAEALNSYKDYYGWEINSRPIREDADAKDVRTWSADQISDRISSILFELWTWRDALADVPTSTVKEFIHPDTYPDKVRGTLADTVAYMLTDKLANSSLWTPAESNGLWKLDIQMLMAPAVRTNAIGPADGTHPLETLSTILRDLEALKADRGLADSAFEARLVLINTLNAHAGSMPKWNRYLMDWLAARLDKGSGFDWWAEGMYVLAEMTRGQDAADSQVRAKVIAQRCIDGRPGSMGAIRCANLISQIMAREIDGLSAQANGPLGRESLILATRNIDHVWFKAWRVDYGRILSEQGVRDPEDEIVKRFRDTMVSRKPDLTWDEPIKDPADFRQHTHKFRPPITEKGAWIVQVSGRDDFSPTDNIIRNVLVFLGGPVVVSERDPSNTSRTIRVLSGDDGNPLQGAGMRLFAMTWQRGEKALSKIADAKTDVAGEAVVKIGGEDRQVLGVVDYEGLTWPMMTPYDFGRTWFYGENERNALIFTDRSIYRPGQKILFKIQRFSRETTGDVPWVADRGVPAVVELRDTNYADIGRITVVTNEWGSASGEFEIPEGKMLGAWTIVVDRRASTSIRVEEYRIPSFTVDVDNPEGLRLNKQADLSGNANYFFGLPVSGGRISWKVQRQERWPWWCWYRQSRTEIIAAGTGETDEKGKFHIGFMAEAGEKPEGGDIPDYTFMVDVDITDDAGETHSASRYFNMGWSTVKASASIDNGFFDAGKPVEIRVSRNDINGNPAAGDLNWSLFRIADPDRPQLPSDMRAQQDNTPWGRRGYNRGYPEGQQYSPEEMIRLRPDGAKKSEGTVSVGKDGGGKVAIGALEAGFWRLRYTVLDQYGAPFSGSFDFNVIAADGTTTLPLLLKPQVQSCEVGDTIRLAIGSAFRDQYAVLQVMDRTGLIETRRVKLDPGTDILTWKVTRSARGGIYFRLISYRDYQNLTQTTYVRVPWSDRQLKVSIEKFRDKVVPGGRETISVKVADPAGKAVPAAEVLAWMYDRSLDDLAALAIPDMMGMWPSTMMRLNVSDNLRGATGIHTSSNGFETKFIGVVDFEPDRLVYLETWRRHFGRGYIGYGEMGGSGGGGIRTLSAAPMAMAKSETLADGDAGVSRDKAVAEPEGMNAVAAEQTTGDKAAPAPAADGIRSNFAETAFFMPHLITGKDGLTSLEYEVPDSITTWKIVAAATTKDLRSGRTENKVISSRDLMVKPFLPRFMREGDVSVITAVVANTTDSALKGSVTVAIEDSITGQSMNDAFGLKVASAAFVCPPKGETTVYFEVTAPSRPGPVSFRIKAASDALTDGELRSIPILPGRYHLAQSRFVTMHGKEAGGKDRRTLEFKDMKVADATRINEKLVVTVDGQLFMSVLSALPYLTEYPYECAEQTLNRFVSTGIVSSLFKKYPGVAAMAKRASSRETQFEAWDRKDPNRKIALEETPWLRESTGEGSARFFKVLDPGVAERTKKDALDRLAKMQHADGAFPWFPGGPPSQWMTLYVVAGLSRAMEFDVEVPADMISGAMTWTHNWYLTMKAEHPDWVKNDWSTATFLVWVLSNLPEELCGGFTASEEAELLKLSFENWKLMSVGMKSMLTMTLHRAKRPNDAKLVWDSVMDAARSEQDRGMFWAQEDRSWLWYNDTIENHARAIRTLEEIDPGSVAIDDLVLWLFINKKLNHWKSTRATAEVLYALAHHLSAQKELGVREVISVSVGDQARDFVFDPLTSGETSGQLVIDGPDVDESKMSTVTVSKETPGWALASATWHFSTEQLPDKGDGDLLKIERKYFLKKKSLNGPVLEPVTDVTELKPGDEVEVQISIQSGEPVEYVHLRDPRPAGFEPVKSVSGYNWNFGIYWYEEVRDSGENFFFEHLPRGEYTFRYSIRAALAGTFKAAPATIQPMYAPEFAAYSAGRLIRISPSAE